MTISYTLSQFIAKILYSRSSIRFLRYMNVVGCVMHSLAACNIQHSGTFITPTYRATSGNLYYTNVQGDIREPLLHQRIGLYQRTFITPKYRATSGNLYYTKVQGDIREPLLHQRIGLYQRTFITPTYRATSGNLYYTKVQGDIREPLLHQSISGDFREPL